MTEEEIDFEELQEIVNSPLKNKRTIKDFVKTIFDLSNKNKQLEKENAELLDKLNMQNQRLNELKKENAELKEQLKMCQSVASEIVNKMKNCGNCKYFTRELLNCENIRICKVNPNNIYGVCDIWEFGK